MIKILIDSGSDRSAWMDQHYDYDFMPLTVIVDGKAYLDRDEIQTDQLTELMKNGIVPTTSQVSPGLAQNIVDRYCAAGDDLIYISLWKELSGTYSVMKQIQREYKEKYPNFKFEIIDCLSGSVAGTNIALQAMELVRKDYSFQTVVTHAQTVAAHTKIFLTVDDMSWLAKGGRLPKMVGNIGTALNIKPVLTVDDHSIQSAGLVRGEKKLLKRLVQEMEIATGNFTDQIILISHVGQKEKADNLAAQLKEKMPHCQTAIFEFGAVLASHIGLGGLAVCCLTERPKYYQKLRSLD